MSTVYEERTSTRMVPSDARCDHCGVLESEHEGAAETLTSPHAGYGRGEVEDWFTGEYSSFWRPPWSCEIEPHQPPDCDEPLRVADQRVDMCGKCFRRLVLPHLRLEDD